MKSYSQRDNRWSNVQLGSPNYTLGRFGCTTTCIADLSTYFGDNLTPDQVAQKLTYVNGLVLWSSATFPSFTFEKREYGRNNGGYLEALRDPDRAVIFNVANGSHWVIATGYGPDGLFKIADPWLGDNASMSRYGDNIVGAAYFKRVKSVQPVQPSKKFTMNYTVFNTDPSLMEQARQLLNQYSNGVLDCHFTYLNVLPETLNTLWTTEAQITFLAKNPVITPFAYLTYQGNDPGHIDAVTRETPGNKTILTASFPNQTPFNACYEMVHAVQMFLLDRGFPVGIPDDVFTPDMDFLKKKLSTILPFVNQL